MNQVLFTVLFYAIPHSFIFFFAYYTKWQIADELDGIATWTAPDVKWHRFGLLMRGSFFCAMAGWVISPHIDPLHLLILAPTVAAHFDMGINFARKRPLFAVGVDGWDKKIGKWKWPGYALFFTASVIIKILL